MVVSKKIGPWEIAFSSTNSVWKIFPGGSSLHSTHVLTALLTSTEYFCLQQALSASFTVGHKKEV